MNSYQHALINLHLAQYLMDNADLKENCEYDLYETIF